MESLKAGNGLEPGIDLGHVNSAEQRKLISDMANDLIDKTEGTIRTGGCLLTGPAYDAGYFYAPTPVSVINLRSRLLNDEIFGPVLPVMSVPDLETAIREANRSRYSLSASIWTSNLATTKQGFN
ncbi:MAG: aldehyde dehydrogenase family protein [Methanomicrobiales archaeon]